MNRKLSLAVVVFSAFAVAVPAFAAPQAPAGPNYPDTVTNYVKSVRKTVKTTDMAGYLAAVKDPKGALLLDVREPEEYQSGHIPGTVNIPRGLLEFAIYKQLGFPKKTVDTSQTIYVQCRTGGRATLATDSLKKIGFTNPVAVVMDIADWEKAGNPWVKPAAMKK